VAAGAPFNRVVLVVEDDAAIRAVISDVLEERGFRVLVSSNGAEALDYLETLQPDVVVLDLLMPVMHGWEFMESYIERTRGKPIPIVVVSVNPVLPRSYDKFGVRVCLRKPFQVDELLRAVEESFEPVPA
jgi:CheY-like chemotaxis protein